MSASHRAVGALIWKNPERILEAAAQLRGTDAVLECRLRGGSMGEAIPAGSKLRIAVGSTAAVRVGEVVAFVQGAGLCVHRVAYRSGERLITQGDACLYPDEPIEASHVLGPVTERFDGAAWAPVEAGASRGRSGGAAGHALLRIVAGLMVLDVRLARVAARALRLRKEGPANAQGNEK